MFGINKKTVKKTAKVAPLKEATLPVVVEPVIEAVDNSCSECSGLGLVGNLDVAGKHSLCPKCAGKGII